MKLQFAAIAAAVFAVGMIVSTPSCCLVGNSDEPLFVAADVAWPGVEADIEVGIDDGVDDGDLDDPTAAELRAQSDALGVAIETRNADGVVLIEWVTLNIWANRGINTRLEREEIGPNGAGSLRERLSQFDDTVKRLGKVGP